MVPYVTPKRVKTKSVLFSLPLDLHERFSRWAKSESRSMSAQAKKAVLEAMEKSGFK